MIQKAIKLSLLVLLSLYGTQGFSQIKITNKELLKEILEEKMRMPPVSIEKALAREKEVRNEALNKKTRATELKVSTNATTAVEEGEAQIAMDPSNNSRMVMSYMEQDALGLRFPVYYSNNGGSNWQLSSFSSLGILNSDIGAGTSVLGGGDPVFSYDKTGKLFFSWIYLYFKPNLFDTAFVNMYWASSTDNGATWTTQPGSSKYIAHAALDLGSGEALPPYEGFHDRQWFAHDLTNGPNANALYCSCVYFPTTVEPANFTGTYVQKKPNANNSFSPKKQVFSGTTQFGNLVVDNTGNIHVTFVNLDFNTVNHASSSDGGTTFSAPHQISAGTNLFGNQGNGFVHDRENSAVNLAIDGTGFLHVVWTDFPANTGPDYHSYYSVSKNGGVTWSTPKELFFGTNKAFMPVVCAAGSKVTIGGYGVSATKISDYYIMTSVDNGNTFWAAQKISTQSTNFGSGSNSGKWFGDYYNAVRTGNKVYNIWSDGRGSAGTKMYVSTTLEPVGIQEITSLNGSFNITSVYPNPVSSQFNFDVETNESHELSISILSADGKIIQTEDRKIASGKSTINMSSKNLAVGNYVLSVTSEDGTRFTRMISKQ
jgi:Secretion system C-terminal sorting domain